MSGEPSARLALLIEKHLEGTLSEPEAEELTGLLEDSEEAFRIYLETSEVETPLRIDAILLSTSQRTRLDSAT